MWLTMNMISFFLQYEFWGDKTSRDRHCPNRTKVFHPKTLIVYWQISQGAWDWPGETTPTSEKYRKGNSLKKNLIYNKLSIMELLFAVPFQCHPTIHPESLVFLIYFNLPPSLVSSYAEILMYLFMLFSHFICFFCANSYKQEEKFTYIHHILKIMEQNIEISPLYTQPNSSC